MKKTALALFLFLTLFSAQAAGAAPKALTEPIFDEPALITVVGQSMDAQMVNVLFKRGELRATLANLAEPGVLADMKTLVLVIGASPKGLGAAGINAEQEAKRVQALIGAAEAAGIGIMTMHIGGESRRGALTDRYIPQCTGPAQYAIVVERGDHDHVFAKAMDGKFMDYAKSANDAVSLIQKAFR